MAIDGFEVDVPDTEVNIAKFGYAGPGTKGKWKGGRRPFGYTVNTDIHTLVIHPPEAAIIRLIFELYIRDRLGSVAVAKILNDRGHHTNTGKR
ncbi:MAG: recombinase family protein [Pseudonocardiaceae bacterium]